jgi:hypothetical protein
VKEVVPQSLRGLNATLRLTGGSCDESITRALGHVDISTTKRSYFAPGAAEQTAAKRSFGRLMPHQDIVAEKERPPEQQQQRWSCEAGEQAAPGAATGHGHKAADGLTYPFGHTRR